MKRIFGFLFASCLSLMASAQYTMSNTTVSTCSGNFYDSGGPSSNYGNNQNLTMTFTSSNGNRVIMAFNSFYIESFDRLYIYDGPTAAYPLLGAYYTNPGTITSTGSSLTFVFTSDISTTYDGWAATISCGGPAIPWYPLTNSTVTVCEGLFFDSGAQFANYQDNENRVMTFTSASGQYLKFDFNPNFFDIAANDSLFVYDGTSTSAPLFAILTGTGNSPGTLTSHTSSFTFRFKSDAAMNTTGWRALISCVSVPDNTPYISMTGGVCYTCGGYFFDVGGGSSDYPDNDTRVQTFYSNSGCQIRFTFTVFDTEGCCDRLYIYDGPTIASPLIATLSGGGIPSPIQSTGNALTFRFVSDGTFHGAGWGSIISCPNQPLAGVTADGPTTFCGGDTVMLTSVPSPNYLWNTGDTTQSIAVTTSGSYWVSVANASNCAAISPITVVNVLPTPAAAITSGGPTTFCMGDTLTLTASGGTTYTWSDNSTGSLLDVTQAGTYYVIAQNGGCTDTSAGINVNVNPLPVVALTLPLDTFCISPQLFTLSGGSPAGGVYSGPGVSGGQLNPFVAGAGTHTMSYTYTDPNSCVNIATQSFMVDLCTGLSTPSVNGAFSVSPNPTNDLLLITFASGTAVDQIKLMDVTGRVVLEQSTNGQMQITLPMKALPSGIYLLRTVGGTNETIRVVKE
ncbi:hypothetical protein BH11BAC7_BH11BAC7_06950 [soil metagenome]